MNKPKYDIGDNAYIFEGSVDGLPDITKLEITGVRLVFKENDIKEFWYATDKNNDHRLYFKYSEDELFDTIQKAVDTATEFFQEIILQK